MKKTAVILVMLLLSSPIYINFPTAHAQKTTLAQEIYAVTSRIQSNSSSWNVIYGQIFGLQNNTVFDNSIVQALHQENYGDVIFIARLAEINGYSSSIINDSVRYALTNMSMCGSLPITVFQGGVRDCFSLYDRYMVNAYRYAQQQNVPGWNLTQAYLDFVKAYMSHPEGSSSGEMLWINPQKNYAASFSSRYYDEHAETLAMFLEFYLSGVPDAMRYADDAWLSTQYHWGDNNIYGYGPNGSGVECEMGPFAQIISEYRNARGEIPYFGRVVADLQNKLLIDKYDSPGWGVPGVIKHMGNNLQLRLQETMGALIAMQMLYPNFTANMKNNFKEVLATGGLDLANSDLRNGDAFRFFDTTDDFSDCASLLGAMTLFMYGIIPDSGYLAINASEERCQDMRTCFPISQWSFNYADSMIRIPVRAGNLSFNFGSQKVTQSFDSDGVYNVYFTSDWNNVTSIQKIADITTLSLQPVTLQAIPKPYLNQTDATANPTPSNQNNPASEPTPTLNAISTQTSLGSNPTETCILVLVGSIIGLLIGVAAFRYAYAKRRNRQIRPQNFLNSLLTGWKTDFFGNIY